MTKQGRYVIRETNDVVTSELRISTKSDVFYFQNHDFEPSGEIIPLGQALDLRVNSDRSGPLPGEMLRRIDHYLASATLSDGTLTVIVEFGGVARERPTCTFVKGGLAIWINEAKDKCEVVEAVTKVEVPDRAVSSRGFSVGASTCFIEPY